MQSEFDDIMSSSPTWPSVKAQTSRESHVLDCARHIRRHPRDPHLAEVKVSKAREQRWVTVLTYFTGAVYQ